MLLGVLVLIAGAGRVPADLGPGARRVPGQGGWLSARAAARCGLRGPRSQRGFSTLELIVAVVDRAGVRRRAARADAVLPGGGREGAHGAGGDRAQACAAGPRSGRGSPSTSRSTTGGRAREPGALARCADGRATAASRVPRRRSCCQAGRWYFDRQALELVYVPHLRLASGCGRASGRKRVRFRVQVLRAAGRARARTILATIGLQLVPVEALPVVLEALQRSQQLAAGMPPARGCSPIVD